VQRFEDAKDKVVMGTETPKSMVADRTKENDSYHGAASSTDSRSGLTKSQGQPSFPWPRALSMVMRLLPEQG
jgi:hypothetical protein